MRVNKHYLFGTRRKLNPVVIPHLVMGDVLKDRNIRGTAQSHIVNQW